MYCSPHLGKFMKTSLNFAEITFAQATSWEVFGNHLELRRNAKMSVNFRKSPSNFIKIKLYSNHCSDNLMKPPQALHNNHLFKPPLDNLTSSPSIEAPNFTISTHDACFAHKSELLKNNTWSTDF
jgi:hypothetical protein